MNIILITSIIPLVGVALILPIPKKYNQSLKLISLLVTSICFLSSTFMWILFDPQTSFFQFTTTLVWLPFFNLNYTIGVDGISLFFVILSTFLILICILNSWNSIEFQLKEYLICFLILEFFLIQVFCVLDILLFYIFFESILIPMFLIVGIWGSRLRKIRAAYQFFIYTLVGSLMMLISLIFVYLEYSTTDLQILNHISFCYYTQVWLWIAFFASLSVKIPMVPFHIWLPEAHAEAPTAGSIILAGVLLKIGGYGFLRFSIPLFPEASIFFAPLVFTLSIIAIIYASFTTLRQVDLKKIIAYSSVSHMGFVTIGIFSLNCQGIEGSIFLMLSHGLVSGALFLCIGVLYDRYKTRLLKYYGGLVQVMPLFTLLFTFFTFSNIGFPCTSSFIGEILILIGSFQCSFILTFFASLGVILSAAYSIWLLNRVSFSTLKLFYFNQYQDVSRREFFLLIILVFTVLWLGIFPYKFLNELHFSVINLLEQII